MSVNNKCDSAASPGGKPVEIGKSQDGCEARIDLLPLACKYCMNRHKPGPAAGSLARGVAGVGVEGVGKRSWGVPGLMGV